MPFYDLHCTDCDKDFNIMATVTDKTQRRIPCPECGSTNMETVYLSAPAYIKSRGDNMPSCPKSGTCGSGGNCRFAG